MTETKSHIAWIYGSYHDRRRHMAIIRKKFANCGQYVADNDVSFEYLMTEIQGTGCFDDKKLVIINEMPNFKDSNKQKYLKIFKQVLDNLDEDIFVIINGINPKKERALFNHVKKIGGKIKEFKETIDSRQAPNWIMNKLEERGFKLDNDIAQAIIEANGYDSSLNAIGIDMLEMAMMRIANYMGNRAKKITFDIVEATAASHANFVIWDMLNAVDNRNYERCIELLTKSCIVNTNVISAVIQMLNMMFWKYRLLWMLKDKITVTGDFTEAAKLAISLKKLKGTGTGMSRHMNVDIIRTGENKGSPATQWAKNSIREALEGRYGKTAAIELYSRRELYQIIWAIQSALMAIRETSSENEGLLIIDMVLMTICKVGDYGKIRSIIKSFEEIHA